MSFAVADGNSRFPIHRRLHLTLSVVLPILMPMRYPGGKGHTFQHIINLIPPHSTFIEAFLGSGAVLRHKQRAKRDIGVEIDANVLAQFREVAANYELVCGDAFHYLASFPFDTDDVVYCDPPYLPATRRRLRVYRHDLSEQEHIRLLLILQSLPCRVLISGYENPIYKDLLRTWVVHKFMGRTHCGPREENVWLNYETPKTLHDARYIGSNFRHRQDTKRRLARLKRRIECLSAPERSSIKTWMLNEQEQVTQKPTDKVESPMKNVLNKLVRDKVPKIIRDTGRDVAIRVLEDHEYLSALQAKLHEEAKEFEQTKDIEELADILEVIRAIALTVGVDLLELERLRAEKYSERGGFEHRVFLTEVTTSPKRHLTRTVQRL